MSDIIRIMTIGHSTRPPEQFIGLLQAHGVTAVADVRTVPRSRRHPHYSRDALPGLLASHGIAYEHFPGLGGLRKPRPDSKNTAWRHPSFRAYADHMQSGEFRQALEDLLAFARKFFPAVMCAEAQWWQCHRQLDHARRRLERGAGLRDKGHARIERRWAFVLLHSSD